MNMASGSPLFDLYQSDPDRAVLECIDRLQQTQEESIVREIEEIYGQFLKDKRRFPESVATKYFDSLIEGLLTVCNTHPSPEAARAMGLLLSFLSSDDRISARFKPSKVSMVKLALASYIQGPDRQRAQTAMDFALFLLRTYESLDLTLISADAKVISRIMWADRQRMWVAMKERDTELPDVKYQLQCLKASIESQFAAMSEMRSMQQEGSLATHSSAMVDVEGDMRRVLGTVKQLELASKSQAASIRALEIASKSQSSAVQQLQSTIRDEKASLRALREAVDKIEHSTIQAIVDVKGVSASNKNTIEDVQHQVSIVSSDLQAVQSLVKTQAEGLQEVDAVVRSQREQLTQLEGTIHPLFQSVETLETLSRSQDNTASKVKGDMEQTIHHLKGEVQGILSMLKQFDGRVNDQRDKIAVVNQKLSDTTDTLTKVSGQVRVATTQLDTVSTTHESSLQYLKDTVKQQGFSIQKLKMGSTGAPSVSGSATTTGTATPTILSPRGSIDNGTSGASLVSIAALESKFKGHESYVEGLERTLQQQKIQIQELQAQLQTESSNLAKLSATTDYDLRQLRTTSESHDFSLHDVVEHTKSTSQELQSLQQQYKGQEMELHKLMATAKYQSLTITQLESTTRNSSSDLHHLKELTANLESRVQSAVSDFKAHDSSLLKFKSDVELTLTQLTKTADIHSKNLYDVQDMAKSSETSIHLLEGASTMHDSLLTGLTATVDSGLQQLRSAVESLDMDTRQALSSTTQHTAQIRDLETTSASHEISIQELKAGVKTQASADHQNTLRVNNIEQSLQKLSTASRQLASSSQQVSTMLSAQEQAVEKLRDHFDQSLTSIRSSVKTLESESAQGKLTSKSNEINISKVADTLRSFESDLSQLHTAARTHEEVLQKLIADTETINQSFASLAATMPQRDDSFVALKQTVDTLRASLQQQREAGAQHEATLQELSAARREMERVVMNMQKVEDSMQKTIAVVPRMESEMTSLRDAGLSAEVNVARGDGEPPAKINIFHLLKDVQLLQQQTSKMSTVASTHEQVLTDLRAAVTDVIGGLGMLRSNTQSHASEITRLKESAQTSVQGVALASESRQETREFINQEARAKAKDLLKTGVSVNDKLVTMGWVARNMKFLEKETIQEAVSNFREYSSNNKESFNKSQARLPEVVQAVIQLIEPSSKDTQFLLQLLDVLDCLIISDGNLETAVTVGFVEKMLKLSVHTSDTIKAKALQVLAGAARSDAVVRQLLELQAAEPLVSLLRWDDALVVSHACSVVRMSLRTEEGCRVFNSHQVVTVLIDLLIHSDTSVRENASGGLRNLTSREEYLGSVADNGGLEQLVRVARETNVVVSKNAIAALRNCAKNPKYQKQIHILGGLDLLGLRYPVVK